MSRERTLLSFPSVSPDRLSLQDTASPRTPQQSYLKQSLLRIRLRRLNLFAPISPANPTYTYNTTSRLAFRAIRAAGLAVGLGLTALAAYQQSQQNRQENMASTARRGHLDTTAGREVVYCHACENEWYHDEHGLECPRCESEATEIVSLLYTTSLAYA